MQIELLVPDLMAASRLRAAVTAALTEWASVSCQLLLIDVGPTAAKDWASAIESAKADGGLVIAFAPHAMAARLAEAKRAGADLLAVNGDMLTDPLAVIRRLMDSARPPATRGPD